MINIFYFLGDSSVYTCSYSFGHYVMPPLSGQCQTNLIQKTIHPFSWKNWNNETQTKQLKRGQGIRFMMVLKRNKN